MTKLIPSLLTFLIAFTGCISEPDDRWLDDDDDDSTTKKKDDSAASSGSSGSSGSSSSASSSSSSSSKPSFTPLPEQTPKQGRAIRSPDQIFRTNGEVTASAPTVRAADRHTFSIKESDCLSCHKASGGTAPAFAFAGTIALGQKWVVAPPGWEPGDLPGQPNTKKKYGDYGYDDYDDYGDYDDCYDDYDNYGYGYDYDYDDDYGYGECRRKGWPEYRNDPSPSTQVRMVGSDGKVFETVTDEDGNFWFKSSSAEVKQPAFTGVRKGEFQISGASNGVACGSCHESKAPNTIGRIWTWPTRTPR